MKLTRLVGLAAASTLTLAGLFAAVPSQAASTSVASVDAEGLRVRPPTSEAGETMQAQSTSIAQAPIRGRSTTHTNAAVQAAPQLEAEVVKIAETGEPGKRLNFVFLGDGYTAGEQDNFVQYAREKWQAMFKFEPFKSYQGAMNAYAVKVVSPTSGISDGRGAAMGSYLNCYGHPMLVCADLDKVKGYAKNAPKADQMLVLLNTTKDVGAGYPTEAVALVTGHGSDSNEAAIHEYGHSLGGLQDEYGDGGLYNGEEPVEPNASKDRSGGKWSSFLGQSTPDGGKIGAFEGAAQFTRGIYRPSQNSAMRTVGRPFNLVGQAALIKGIMEQAPDFRPGGSAPSESVVPQAER